MTDLPPLPNLDCVLLRTLERVVPAVDREDWARAWRAELWHLHHRRESNRKGTVMVTDRLLTGIVRDAFWLRTESCRRSLSGTATLCLGSLLALSVLSTLFAMLLGGGWHQLWPGVSSQFTRTLCATPLVVVVAFATATRRHIEPSSGSRFLYRLRRLVFFAVKLAQVLLLAFLLSTDICLPLHASLPNTADICQIFGYVAFALLGLRWAFRDQEERCKHCLQSLATPARVGRPSHNLLEWNGTELSCKRGHGLLSIPEIETSWCRASQWRPVAADWDQASIL